MANNEVSPGLPTANGEQIPENLLYRHPESGELFPVIIDEKGKRQVVLIGGKTNDDYLQTENLPHK